MSLIQKASLRTGHLPTLLCAFLTADIASMVWFLLGPLAVQIVRTLHLGPARTSLMVALPILSGAILRVPGGLLVDRLRPKRAGVICQCIVLAILIGTWLLGAPSYPAVLLLGALLGMAGASVAVALPLALRWFPPEAQSVGLRFVGAGDLGAVCVFLLAPLLAIRFGLTGVFGLAAIPVGAACIACLVLARDAPNQPPRRSLADYGAVLRDRDAWWFMLFYLVSFGGFSGLAASLAIYFNAEYGLNAVRASCGTAACVLAGGVVRPLGSTLADRIGGIRTLFTTYSVATVALILVSARLPTLWAALGVFILAMMAFGMGNGAVFRLLPQRFAREIGVMTGLVGTAGGVGGFLLAVSLGIARHYAGSYGPGFLVFAALAVIGLTGLSLVKLRWRTTWGAAPGIARI